MTKNQPRSQIRSENNAKDDSNDPQPPMRGRCLCGAVSYRVQGVLRPVWDCHCVRCRRWTGHHIAATGCDRERIRILGDEALRWHHPEEYPQVAYGFCVRCGSSLFWTVVGSDTISICAGTLEPPTGLHTQYALFTEDASDYHTLNLDIPPLPR
ncbi:GFA family protein [Candidatus Poriferisocius sp.]|uniref:GFA family protein n=1 Tax=Candidatus Poriferisocius sp. TaxID=3101276 RepID=UPI003B5B460A